MASEFSNKKVFVILKQNQVNAGSWNGKDGGVEDCGSGALQLWKQPLVFHFRDGKERKVKGGTKVQGSGRIRK